MEKGPVVFEDISRSSGLATWKYVGGTAAKALIVESLGAEPACWTTTMTGGSTFIWSTV